MTATNIRTVTYSFPSVSATLTSGSNRDLSKTCSLYEVTAGAVSIEEAWIEVYFSDDIGAAASLTALSIGAQIDGGGFTNLFTLTDTITNSGEAQNYIYACTATSFFQSNWTADSHTVDIRITPTGVATNNHCARLHLTVRYDEMAVIRVKTIRVPIETTRTTLTTSFQTVGGSTAILGTSQLPESIWNIESASLELWFNEATNSTGNFNLQTRINGANAAVNYRSNSALNSARWGMAIREIVSLLSTSDLSLECLSETTTGRINMIGGWLAITYSYDHSNTTERWVSVIKGGIDEEGRMGATAVADQSAYGSRYFVTEDTPTLKPSAVYAFFNSAAGFNLSLACGNQSDTTYVPTAGNLQCGQWSVCHRIDAGGTAGADFGSFALGGNDLKTRWRSSNASEGFNMSGFILINYTHSGSNIDDTRDNWTVFHLIAETGADAISRTISTSSALFEGTGSYYFINGAVIGLLGITDNVANGGFTVLAERTTGEGFRQVGDGWETMYQGTYRGDNENANITCYGVVRDSFKRWAGDLDSDRMNLNTARRWRIDCLQLGWFSIMSMVTWSQRTWEVTGSVSGASGNGLTVYIHRDSDKEPLVSALTVSGVSPSSTFNSRWYIAESVYADLYQSSAAVGRSAPFLPTAQV